METHLWCNCSNFKICLEVLFIQAQFLNKSQKIGNESLIFNFSLPEPQYLSIYRSVEMIFAIREKQSHDVRQRSNFF
jgi:hypothetical protein